MAEGFKVADAFIEVHVDDDTARGRRAIERKTLNWANILGLRLGKILTVGIGKALLFLGKSVFWFSAATIAAAALAKGVIVLSQVFHGLGIALVQSLPAFALVIPAALTLVSIFAALKIATKGVGDALKAGWSGDAAAMAEAMKNLGEAAQTFVKEIVKLKEPLQDLKRAVQDSFFGPIIGGRIRELAENYLPMIQDHLATIALAFGRLAAGVIDLFNTAEFIKDWQTTFTNIETVVGNLTQGLLPILDIFRNIGTVASEVLAHVTGGFSQWALRVSEVVQQMRETGQLKEMIEGGLNQLGMFWQLFKNIFSIIGSVFRIISETGGGAIMLRTMVEATGALKDLLKTAEGSSALRTIFETLNETFANLKPGIMTVFKALGQGLANIAPLLPLFGSTLNFILIILAPILPLLGAFIDLLGRVLAPVLEALAPLVMTLVDEFFKALRPLLPPINRFLMALVGIVRALVPIVVDLLVAFSPLVGSILVALAGILERILPLLVQWWDILAAALLPVLDELIPVIITLAETAIAVWFEAVKALLPVFMELLPYLSDLLVELLPQLIPLIKSLARVFFALLPAIIPLIGLFLKIISLTLPVLIPAMQMLVFVMELVADIFENVVAPIARFIGWLATTVSSFIDLGRHINVFRDLWSNAWRFIQMVWDTARAVITNGIAGLRILWNNFTDFIRTKVGEIGTNIMKIVTWVVDMKNKAAAKISEFIAIFRGVKDRITEALSGLATRLFNIGMNIVFSLWDGVKSLWNWLKDKVKGFVQDAISNVISSALQAFSPSRVAIKLGRSVPQGLAIGLDKDRRKVSDAAQRLAVAAIPNLGSSSSGVTTTSAGGRGGSGLHVENLTIQAYSERFSLLQVQEDLAWMGAH